MLGIIPEAIFLPRWLLQKHCLPRQNPQQLLSAEVNFEGCWNIVHSITGHCGILILTPEQRKLKQGRLKCWRWRIYVKRHEQLHACKVNLMYQVYSKAWRQGCVFFFSKRSKRRLVKGLKFTKYTKNTMEVFTIFEKHTPVCDYCI